MKSNTIILCFALICSVNTFAQVTKLKTPVALSNTKLGKAEGLSEEEIGKGLKEALNEGVKKGVSKLSQPDGYFKDLSIKILMPEDAKKVEEKLRLAGKGKMVDDLIESMNRAAEDAANASKDIFLNTIQSMTLTDAMGILKGAENAATQYLNQATRAQLYEKFAPVIKASLDRVGTTDLWNLAFTAYNKIPLVTKVDTDLTKYATNKAIDGLFVQIAKQEKEIRQNPAARVSDILKKVFN